MEKLGKALLAGAMGVIVLGAAMAVYGAPAVQYSVQKGETVTRDRFVIQQSIVNEGTIQGDLIAAAQNISTAGVVEGDLLSASNELNIGGKIGGDLRSAGAKIVIEGEVGKNVNIFFGNADIKGTSNIEGNLAALGGDIRIDGKVNGYTRIEAANIILNGEFMGDIEVNLDGPDEENTEEKIGFVPKSLSKLANSNVKADTHGPQLTLLPGTVIHGKLTYKGIKEASVQNGAKINEIQWIKTTVKNKKQTILLLSMWSIVRLAISTAAYFLIGILMYRWVPVIFRKQSDVIRLKPLNVFGIGLLALFASFAAVIVLIILVLLSIGLINAGLPVFYISIVVCTYAGLFYLSSLPVSLWLGSRVLGDRYSDVQKLAAGLGLLTFTLFMLKLLSEIPAAGIFFGLAFILTRFTVLVMGTGALLHGLYDIYFAVRRYEASIQSQK